MSDLISGLGKILDSRRAKDELKDARALQAIDFVMKEKRDARLQQEAFKLEALTDLSQKLQNKQAEFKQELSSNLALQKAYKSLGEEDKTTYGMIINDETKSYGKNLSDNLTRLQGELAQINSTISNTKGVLGTVTDMSRYVTSMVDPGDDNVYDKSEMQVAYDSFIKEQGSNITESTKELLDSEFNLMSGPNALKALTLKLAEGMKKATPSSGSAGALTDYQKNQMLKDEKKTVHTSNENVGKYITAITDQSTNEGKSAFNEKFKQIKKAKVSDGNEYVDIDQFDKSGGEKTYESALRKSLTALLQSLATTETFYNSWSPLKGNRDNYNLLFDEIMIENPDGSKYVTEVGEHMIGAENWRILKGNYNALLSLDDKKFDLMTLEAIKKKKLERTSKVMEMQNSLFEGN